MNSLALRFPVIYLLISTLLEVAALPVHVVVFLVRRSSIQRHVAGLLRESSQQ